MAAVGFQGAGERNQVVTACAKSIAFTINRFHLADNRLTACQRSGFVKGDRFGIRKTFQVDAAFKDDTGFGSSCETTDHGDGSADHQSTGTTYQ